MDLEEKIAEYEIKKPLLAATRLARVVGEVQGIRRQIHDVRLQLSSVQRVVANGLKIGGREAELAMGNHRYFGEAFRDELDELRAETFDAPYRCSSDFYQAVVESLGFERVATYKVAGEKTCIYARPDGVFLNWNTDTTSNGHVMRGAAKLSFQWVGYEDSDKPEGVSGQFYRAANRAWVYEAIHDAREGVCETIEKLLADGSFCSPYAVHTDQGLLDALISPLDWKQLREKMQQQPGFTDIKLINEMHYVADRRYQDLPLWSQQMLRPLKFEKYYLAAKDLGLK